MASAVGVLFLLLFTLVLVVGVLWHFSPTFRYRSLLLYDRIYDAIDRHILTPYASRSDGSGRRRGSSSSSSLPSGSARSSSSAAYMLGDSSQRSDVTQFVAQCISNNATSEHDIGTSNRSDVSSGTTGTSGTVGTSASNTGGRPKATYNRISCECIISSMHVCVSYILSRCF